MRNAYALLGIMFIIVFLGAYVSSKTAEAPAFLLDDNQNIVMPLSLTSSVFESNEFIPAKYTCDESNINPPLTIEGGPPGTKSFVLVMDDSDIPTEIKASMGIEKFDHWVVYNLPPDTTLITEGAALGSVGANTRGAASYAGPCPPTEYEPTIHRYVFRLYALSGSLTFDKVPSLDEVEAAAKTQMIEKAELIGRYSRADSPPEES